MRLRAMAVELPEVPEHPNRVAFDGVLTVVDEPSTRAPSGARGHRVVLTKAAALTALPSLLGMAVDFTPAWDGHDARRKCGVITEADVAGKQLKVSGYLFAKDYPEVMRYLKRSVRGEMGMSYELANAHVEDMNAQIWTLTRATFTGAAILLRDKAAYRDTHFALTPKRCRSLAAASAMRREAPRQQRRTRGSELPRSEFVVQPRKETKWKSMTY